METRWNGMLALALGALAATTGSAAETDLPAFTRQYLETTGDDARVRDWRLEPADGALLAISEVGGERFENLLSPSGDTLGWKAAGPDRLLTAEREGGKLVITGNRRGEAVAKQLRMPDLPWYQAITFSLEAFVLGDRKEQKFVFLNPEDLEFITLRASLEEVEPIAVEGKVVQARRVSLRLTGWRSAFWSSDYWFRVEDGVFLRYEGVNGPPGTPLTVIVNRTPGLLEARAEAFGEDGKPSRG